MRTTRLLLCIPAAVMVLFAYANTASAGEKWPYSGTNVTETNLSFDALRQKLEAAVTANKMGVVSRASASSGAAGRGIKIPGNAVIGVYRNDFAVRMLKASVPAGIEAPLRFYITEDSDGTARLIYRSPSAVFAPYGSADLNTMAKELDGIFANIAREAVGK